MHYDNGYNYAGESGFSFYPSASIPGPFASSFSSTPSTRTRATSLQSCSANNLNHRPLLYNAHAGTKESFADMSSWNDPTSFNTFYPSGAPPTPISPGFSLDLPDAVVGRSELPWDDGSTQSNSCLPPSSTSLRLDFMQHPNAMMSELDEYGNNTTHPSTLFTPMQRSDSYSRRSSMQLSHPTINLPDLNHLPPPTVRDASAAKGPRSRARRPSHTKISANGASAPLKRKKSASKLSAGARLPTNPRDFASLPPLPPLPFLPPLPSLTSFANNTRMGTGSLFQPSQSGAFTTAPTPLGQGQLAQKPTSGMLCRRKRTSSSAIPAPEFRSVPTGNPLHQSLGDWHVAEAQHAIRKPQAPHHLSSAIIPITPQARELEPDFYNAPRRLYWQ